MVTQTAYDEKDVYENNVSVGKPTKGTEILILKDNKVFGVVIIDAPIIFTDNEICRISRILSTTMKSMGISCQNNEIPIFSSIFGRAG